MYLSFKRPTLSLCRKTIRNKFVTSCQFIVITVLLFSSTVNGQTTFTAKSNEELLLDCAKGTELEREITSDSIQYELRLWVCDFFYPDKLIQITRDFDPNWNYRLGYFKFLDDQTTFAFQDSIKKSIDWTEFENKLNHFIDAKIPNQDEIELLLSKDGYTYRLKNRDFFSSILDGGVYTVEIFDNKTHQTIQYNNPHSYLDKLTKAGLPTKEHEEFIAFTDYIYQISNLAKLRIIQFRETYKTEETKKVRRKKH